eukprot:6213238-Pleurochrysis_carterae.AAC.5
MASVRYVRYESATGRPGKAVCPKCNAQNTLALARSQTAESMWPLMIAMQAEVSSRSAASEKLVRFGFDRRWSRVCGTTERTAVSSNTERGRELFASPGFSGAAVVQGSFDRDQPAFGERVGEVQSSSRCATERRQGERTLRRQEARWRALP